MHPPAPGRLFDLGGFRLHADFRPGPAGAPTVVMDAALGGTSLGWFYVERGLRDIVSTFRYDRAGLGWSEFDPEPQTLERQTANLHSLLAAAAAPSPYILVGHSYGALIAHWLAVQERQRVAGLVLVDPPELGVWSNPDPEHRARLEAGIRLARRGVLAARCGAAQLTAWLVGVGALSAAANLTRWVSGGRFRPTSEFNFSPAAHLPPEDKPVLRWFWTRPRFYRALAAQMEALPAACRAVAAASSLNPLPLRVLSAADTPAAQRAEHERLAAQSRHGAHLAAHASGHWIPLEEPELVLRAVVEVMAAARLNPVS